MRGSHRNTPRRRAIAATVELVALTAATTGILALLNKAAPARGLAVVYLLPVLIVAIRRGEIPALATALLSVLTLNFFFIAPRYRLEIAHTRDLVVLAVLLATAVVVGRLAAESRRRAEEAEHREREAALLAASTASALDGPASRADLEKIVTAVEAATNGDLRLALTAAPAPREGEASVALPSQEARGWIHTTEGGSWSRPEVDRVAPALGRLIDLAVERERISERSAEADATQRADALKTALLHAVSHDLRSPLTAITTAAQGLHEGLSEKDRESLLSVIGEESSRLTKLVDDLLDLSRIEAGAVDPRADWCDLADVATGAAEQARQSSNPHPIEFDLPAGLPLVKADSTQLERVFSNLIENAMKFSPQDTPVRITAGAANNRVTVRVTDRGRGIPRGKRAHVFDPFFRGQTPEAGSGLGLAISRGFVEANGGRIELQGGDGTETSFAVSFPVVAQPAPSID